MGLRWGSLIYISFYHYVNEWMEGEANALSLAGNCCLILQADLPTFPLGQLLRDNLQQIIYELTQVAIDLFSPLSL